MNEYRSFLDNIANELIILSATMFQTVTNNSKIFPVRSLNEKSRKENPARESRAKQIDSVLPEKVTPLRSFYRVTKTTVDTRNGNRSQAEKPRKTSARILDLLEDNQQRRWL